MRKQFCRRMLWLYGNLDHILSVSYTHLPLAMAGEPLKFINSFPSFLAVTVAASFKTQVTPYWSENSLAAARGSSLISSTGFSVSRENSST